MKTIRELLNELPPEIAKQAIENAKQKRSLKSKRENIKEALIAAFIWQGSPQGHDYWNKIHDSL